MFTDLDIFLRERERRGIFISYLDDALIADKEVKRSLEQRNDKQPPIDFGEHIKSKDYIIRNKRA